MLDDITPVILTFNEAANIRRTLSALGWAKRILVVDSGSTDGTVSILSEFPQVKIHRRSFDSHAKQWHYAAHHDELITPWVLRLDADYEVTAALVSEMAGLKPEPDINGYRIRFVYHIFSEPLNGSLYPANTVLLRRGHFSVSDRGHTEVWLVHGRVKDLREPIIHNDWKPVTRWVNSQAEYMHRELVALEQEGRALRRWMRRRPPIMPLVIFLYCMFCKGLIVNGRAGLFYALQRFVAESILALMVLEERLRSRAERANDGG
jgi:glycosyltransferase involved in cell wall biosynthesis